MVTIGDRRWMELFTRLIDRALVDDLAVVHVQLAQIHGVQLLHVAAVPRGGTADPNQLRMDDCQVVYECPIYQPRQ